MTNLPRIRGMVAYGTPAEAAQYFDLNFASVGVSTETGTAYTFRPTDSGGWVRFTSSSAVTATIAPFLSVELPFGAVIMVEQAGTGLVTIVAGSGVTIYGVSSVPGQYSVLRLVHLAQNVWSVTGAGDAGNGFSGYDTRTAAEAASIPASIDAIQTSGYATAGDGGGAIYYRTSGTSAGGFQSADGAWWALASGPVVNVRQFGATGNGVTDDTAAINVALSTTSVKTVYVPPGNYLISSSLIMPYNAFRNRFTGAGPASRLVMATGTFDLITWSTPSQSTFNYGEIDNLCLDGANKTGSGNLINNNGLGVIKLHDLTLFNLPKTGCGILIDGISIYMHEANLENIEIDTLDGLAGIKLGALSSDSRISGVTVQGRSGLDYGIYVATGSGNNEFFNCHPYGASIASMYIGANTFSIWVNGCTFDIGGLPLLMDGASNCTFTDCHFFTSPAASPLITLTNSSNSTFVNCTYYSAASAQSSYAIEETGTSNGNVFSLCNFGGTYASGLFSLLGANSRVRLTGQDFNIAGTAPNLAAGATLFVSNGVGGAVDAEVQVPLPYAGYARKLTLDCATAPGVGETFVATVRKSAVDTALVATITGAASFSNVALGAISFAANDSVSVKVVASGGAATSDVRVSLATSC